MKPGKKPWRHWNDGLEALNRYTEGMRFPTSLLPQGALVLGGALLCAVASNHFAGPERRLAWIYRPLAPLKVETSPLPLPELAPSNIAKTEPHAPLEKPAGPASAIVSPRPKPEAPTPPASKTIAAEPAFPKSETTRQPVREIDSSEALSAFQKGALFLDARRTAEFEAQHIQGAWSLPVWEDGLDTRLAQFEARANPAPNAPLVIYCGGGGCEDSHLLAARLFRLGYRHLLIYREGFPDWQGAHRPVATGARP